MQTHTFTPILLIPFRFTSGPGPSARATNTPSASRQRHDRVPATPASSAAVAERRGRIKAGGCARAGQVVLA